MIRGKMIKKIESVEGIPQTIEEKLEVIRLKINSIIELINKNIENENIQNKNWREDRH